MENLINSDTATTFVILSYFAGVAAGYFFHKHKDLLTSDEE